MTMALCLAGTYKVAPGSDACSNCGQGMYSAAVGAKSNSTCSECPTDSYAPAGSSALTNCTCNAGTYKNSTGSTCSACPANSNAPAGSNALSNCSCNIGFNGPYGGPCMADISLTGWSSMPEISLTGPLQFSINWVSLCTSSLANHDTACSTLHTVPFARRVRLP